MSQFADEIASVAAGGEGLLRKRLAALDPDERRVLRDVLAGLEPVSPKFPTGELAAENSVLHITICYTERC